MKILIYSIWKITNNIARILPGLAKPSHIPSQETVLRFLSRASTNLHLQVFRVVVPSRRLPLADQRRILAKELGDFIHIYNKETVQLSQRVRMRQVLLQTKDNALENQGGCFVNCLILSLVTSLITRWILHRSHFFTCYLMTHNIAHYYITR